MKKLVIAAAAAAMVGGAFAANTPVCGVQPAPVNCYQVYKYTFSGKTTIGIPKAGGDNLCGPAGEACVVRVPGTLKIQGWAAYCFCDCQNTLVSNLPDKQAFWATKPYKADIADGAVTYSFVNVIGKTGNQAEAAGAFAGTLTFAPTATWALNNLYLAGLGKYTSKNATYSLSGNFAGEPAGSWYIKGEKCEQTHVWDCVTMTVNCQDVPNTVAYGKWSVKYSSSDSKKYMNSVLPSTPNYATVH